MSSFVEKLGVEPTSIISDDTTEPLQLVKSHLDAVLLSTKKDKLGPKIDLNEITIEGLDANQVWWQTKLILDNLQSDLLARIQELKEMTTGGSSSSDLENVSSGLEGDQDEEQEEEEEEKEETWDGELAKEGNRPHAADKIVDKEQQSEESRSEEEYDTLQEQPSNFQAGSNEDKDADSNINSINDQFFDIEEFNRQTLVAEEDGLHNQSEDNNEEEDIDYFADIPSEDDEAIYYNDFFDKPGTQTTKPKKSRKNDDVSEPEEWDDEEYDRALASAKLDLFADEEPENSEGAAAGLNTKKELSSFESRQLELQEQIARLEEEAVAEKKWVLKGEVKAQDRPEDALLTEDLEFDRTAKPVPVITSEVTESLEELIRRRIKNYEFDDLEKRVITDVSLKSFKPKFELSDAKSSKSLAELYEDDYKGVSADTEVSEELQKAHDEITQLFENLCYKLDALSSAHFIPKPAQKSLEVRVETPAIAMEDAQPLSMSNASTLAPQEVYKIGKSVNENEITLKNGTVMSKEELNREDKNRLRRAMKRKKRKAARNSQPTPKKSKKNEALKTLSKAKNITIIDKKGEKQDIRGNAKSNNNFKNNNIKL